MHAVDICGVAIGCTLYLIGVMGNTLIILAVWRNTQLRTIPNYLLTNLAFSDIVALVFIPFPSLTNVVKLEDGLISDYLCKFLFLYNIPITSVFASIFTVTVMSVERYNAVVKPLKRGIRLQKESFLVAILAIWIGSILVSLLFYVAGTYFPKTQKCGHGQNQSNGINKYRVPEAVISVAAVSVSFGIISFCYFNIAKDFYFKQKVAPSDLGVAEEVLKVRTQQTRKTVQLSLTITMLFVLCVFPVALVTSSKLFTSRHFREAYKYSGFVFFALTCLNPFIHCYQSSQFRQAFKELMAPYCFRIKRTRHAHLNTGRKQIYPPQFTMELTKAVTGNFLGG